MPFPLKVLIWIMLFMGTLGLLVGTLNLMNPSAVHIPFGPNGESAEGLDGIIASVLSSTIFGLIIGIPAAFLTWLVGPK
ncbi:MAG: hypothetical protein WBC71_06420, partial [Salaquimonas sp.]